MNTISFFSLKMIKKYLSIFLFFLAILAFSSSVRAQSQASAALSMLPLGSVVLAEKASGNAGNLSANTIDLSVAGARFSVKSIQLSAAGTVYLLERLSDGAQLTIEIMGKGAKIASHGVGAILTTSVISTGVLLIMAGEVFAFIPNELGVRLLHNERL